MLLKLLHDITYEETFNNQSHHRCSNQTIITQSKLH